MSDIVRLPIGGEIEQFDPERYRLKQAALDYTIEHAKRIRDWPMLEKAVDDKLTEARKFVAWWKANVTAGHGGNRQVPGTRHLLREAEDLTGMQHQRVSDLGNKLKSLAKFREFLLGVEYSAAYLTAKDKTRGTTGTGQNEWFTPAEYIELARTVLGSIDLDPASHIEAQRTVCAGTFFTKEQDGLQQEWFGNVWLNPPYAQPYIDHFANKMAEEIEVNRITAAIMLTHNYTDTAWFHRLVGVMDAICFTRGRVKFEEPDGTVAAPTQGQAFFYYGAQVKTFVSTFNPIGFITVPRR